MSERALERTQVATDHPSILGLDRGGFMQHPAAPSPDVGFDLEEEAARNRLGWSLASFPGSQFLSNLSSSQLLEEKRLDGLNQTLPFSIVVAELIVIPVFQSVAVAIVGQCFSDLLKTKPQ
jgi:hypothetical protein